MVSKYSELVLLYVYNLPIKRAPSIQSEHSTRKVSLRFSKNKAKSCQKLFQYTSVHCKAIRHEKCTEAATYPSSNMGHCCLTSVKAHSSCYVNSQECHKKSDL